MRSDAVLTVPSGAFVTIIICLFALCASRVEAQTEEARSPAEVLYNIVIRNARNLAETEYEAPRKTRDAVAEMNYQQYRAIRFKPDASIWRGESLFELQLFHTGFLYNEPVQLNLAGDKGYHRRLPFDSDLFRYDGEAAQFAEALSEDAGYAGFRVHYPLNSQAYADELVVFQGATYFRLLSPGQVYGISARGLAIDTAAPQGEEFPIFREFWLKKPGAEDTQLHVFALLDSPSVSGAYHFIVKPGTTTVMDVKAHLFARRDIDKLGLAPLTSMFLYGENRTRFTDDFRPEIHDSDGLLMHTSSGEWIWRPLFNPRQLHLSSLQDTNPRGFGLFQRDRRFEHYEDAEALYHRRPSLWVEPQGDWGEGRVELVEIPTDTETHDNIVAYWIPRETLKAGEEKTFAYRLHSVGALLPQQHLAYVEKTRIGAAGIPGDLGPHAEKERQFMVDFSGEALARLGDELPVKPNLQISSGKMRDLHVFRLPDGDRWRVAFKLLPEGNQPVDMRLFISLRDQRLSEVWNYVWHSSAVE